MKLSLLVTSNFKLASRVRALLGALSTKRLLCAMVLPVLLGSLSLLAQTSTATALTVTSGGGVVTSVATGSLVTLTASVQAGTAKVLVGRVAFCNATAAHCTDVNLLGTAQLTASGTATLKLIPPPGTRSYTARFLGTLSAAPSVSSAASLTISPAPKTYTFIAQSGTSGNYTETANVTGVGLIAPGGTISFLDTTNANYVLGTAQLTNNDSSLTLATSSRCSVGSSSGGVAVGDFNGDGRPDIAVTDASADTLTICLRQADGSFTPLPAQALPADGFPTQGLVVGDFNEDGIPDLVSYELSNVSNNANYLLLLLGNGDGTFKTPGTELNKTNPHGTYIPQVTGDFNGDGHLDIAATQSSIAGSTNYVLLGNGDGTFQNGRGFVTPQNEYTSAIFAADLNNDGRTDLVLPLSSASDSSSYGLVVELGNSDGTFTAVQQTQVFASSPGSSAGIADFNGDGNIDLAFTVGSSIIVLNGKGDGTFTAGSTLTPTAAPSALVSGDFNGDGYADLAAALAGSSNNLAVYPGNGDGTFAAAVSAASASAQGLVTGDFNSDGFSDLAVLTASAVPTFDGNPTSAATVTAPVTTPVGTGMHQIVASYPGDSLHAGSVSGTSGLTARPVATALALSSSTGSATYGTQIVLSATLNPYTAQAHSTDMGTVTFLNGSATLGTATLTSGVAVLNTTTLPIGTDSVSATFAGDSNFVSSTSNAATVSIKPPAPVLAVTVPSYVTGSSSAAVTVSITYSGSVSPTGDITVTIGSSPAVTVPCPGSASPRVCTVPYSIASLVAGSYPVTAVEASDGTYNVANGSATLTITKAQPVVIVAAPAAVSYGTANTTLNASVSYAGPVAPMGGLSFAVGNGPSVTATCVGSASPLACSATYPTAGLTPASYPVTATEAADSNYTVANGPSTLDVNQGTLTLSVASGPASYGQAAAASLSAVLSYPGAAKPTGAFTFLVNGNSIKGVCVGNASPLSCTGNLFLSTFATGQYPVSANIAPDANYASTSAGGNLTIAQATPTLTVSPITISFGTASATLQATVAYAGGAAPSGNTIFTVNGAAFAGSCNVVGLQRLCSATDTSTNTLGPGTYTVNVTELPDANYGAASQSGTLTVSTSPASVIVFPQSMPQGTASTNLTAVITFSAAIAPTGSVTFSVAGVSLPGRCVTAGSTRSCTASDNATGALALGTYPIVVTEAADPNYAAVTGSSSLSIASTVAAAPTFSVPTGSFTAAQTVALNSNQTGATLYYTVDGTAPSTSSTRYTGPLNVTASETVNAIAVVPGYLPSGIGSATYTLLAAPTCTLTVSGTSTSLAVTTSTNCTDPQGLPLTVSLNFGDGTTVTPQAGTTHTFAAPGTYLVTLAATDSAGLTATTIRQATLDMLPQVSAGGSSATTAIVASTAATAQVTFTCSAVSVQGTTITNALPSQYGITCTAPTVTTSSTAAVPVQITIQTTPTTMAAMHGFGNRYGVVAAALPFGALALGCLAWRKRRLSIGLVSLMLVCGTITSCSSGPAFSSPAVVTPKGVYNLNITEVISTSAAPTNFVQTSLIVQLPVTN